MQAVELQRGTRDSSLGVFQSSWIDTHEQSIRTEDKCYNL